MESARDKYTKEIVEAEALWQLPSVDRDGYECGSCGVGVYPASYLKTNLKRPYFSLYASTDHLDGCDVEGDKKTVARGKKGSVREELETSPGLIALMAGSIAGFFIRKPVWQTVQRWLMGSVLMGLAVRMAVEGRR